MESPEKHIDLSQPPERVPSSEQYIHAPGPVTLPYGSTDHDYTAPLQPNDPQRADGTQPNAIPPLNAGAFMQPPARRRSWKAYALGAVVLVLLMLASFGVGSTLVTRPSGSSNTPGSASSVTLPASVTDLQQTIIEVSNQVQPSVVEVTSVGQNSEAIGSGVILTSDGSIATNDHVVNGFSSYTVTLSNGTKYSARLVGQDAQDDLAVLKIAATNLKPIAFADSSRVQVGEFALALGSPLGLENSTTFGIVSAINRTESEAPSGPASELTGLIQTSAAINPGNSGGALVNLQGQLIGMPTLGASNTESGSAAVDIGFAIPSNRIKFVTDQLISSGKLTSSGQGFLGIQGQDVTAQLAVADNLAAQQGVLVTGFATDAAGTSPAQQAGLRAGDVIIAVNGQQISGNDDLASALLNLTPGTQVTLTLLRGSAQQTVKVTLGERPVNSQG
jgi:S1-C subfamily serine protease